MSDEQWETVGVVEALAEVHFEDGRMAFIAEVAEDGDEGFMVRLQSYDDRNNPPVHPLAPKLTGRRVRVTVEVAR